MPRKTSKKSQGMRFVELSGYQKIQTKFPKLNQKCRVSMGKLQKTHTGAEAEGRNQCAINSWKR